MEPDFSSQNNITIDDDVPLDGIAELEALLDGFRKPLENFESCLAVMTGGPAVTSLHNESAFQPAELSSQSSEGLMSHSTSGGASRAVGARPSFGIRHSRMAECCAQILDWLEKPKKLARWAQLKGRSRKEGNKDTTKAFFRKMLDSLHKHGFLPELKTGEHLQRRYNHYVTKYKRVLNWKKDSSFRLTEAELKKGWTIQAKFEKTCPHFERMHSLFEQIAEMGRAREGSV